MWELKEQKGKGYFICWSILKKSKPYNIRNIICRECQEEKLAITSYAEQGNLLNERTEVNIRKISTGTI